MSKEVKVAIFAILVIIIFVVGLNFLRGKGFLDNNSEYSAIFDQVGGMQVSDPIVVNGFQVGKVGEMSLIQGGANSGKTQTTLIIRDDIKVPKGSKAILFSADLLGEMNVKLIFSDTTVFHEEGEVISTKIEGSLFEEIGSELTPLTDKLNLTIDNVNQLFDYEQAQNTQSLNYTIENLNKTMSTFQQTGVLLNSQLQAQLQTLDRIMANLETTTKTINANEANITASVTNVKDLTDNLKTLDLQATLTSVNDAVSELQAAMAKLDDPNNSVGALLTQKELYNNIESSTRNLDLLLQDIRVNPKRYINISVFGGRNKDVTPVIE